MRDDRITFAVIVFLGLTGLLVVAGGLYLAANDKSLPGELIAIGAGAVSAIAAILAAPTGTTEVRVANEMNDPVPVERGGE